MKKRIWSKIATGVVVATAVLMTGCDGKTLELSGYVTDLHVTPTEPCEFTVPKDMNHHEDWPIKVTGVFKLKKSGEVYKFEVEGDPESVLGKADMAVLNEKSRALRYDYCNGGGPVSEHPYLVGITELDETHEVPRLRAFVYFPMRLRYETPVTSADYFYLMLFEVQEPDDDCKPDEEFWAKFKTAKSTALTAAVPTAKATVQATWKAAEEEFVSSWEVRCKALQRLGVLYREQATPAKFRKAVKAEIQNIIPDDPAFVPGFHNGVIHGNF